VFLGYILARLCKEIRHLAYGCVRGHGSVTDKADERTREASVPLRQGGEEDGCSPRLAGSSCMLSVTLGPSPPRARPAVDPRTKGT